MYFSVLLGMQETRPSTLEMACISKWLSYPRRLWNTTGMVVVLGLSRSLRLQALWAAPSVPTGDVGSGPLQSHSLEACHTHGICSQSCGSPSLLLSLSWLAVSPALSGSHALPLGELGGSVLMRWSLGIRQAPLSSRRTAPPRSSNCMPRGVVSSGCCFLSGRAPALRLSW